MNGCGTDAGFPEIDEVSRLVSAKLAAFLRTLRDNGFAVGLQEGRDAAALMAAGYIERPGLLRSALKHLFRRGNPIGTNSMAVRRILARQASEIAIDDHGLGQGSQ